jgi:hypothetical protein
MNGQEQYLLETTLKDYCLHTRIRHCMKHGMCIIIVARSQKYMSVMELKICTASNSVNSFFIAVAQWAELQLSTGEFSFETFVRQGFMKQCSDPHWAPQAHKMKPMNWKFINFVGRFDIVAHDLLRV